MRKIVTLMLAAGLMLGASTSAQAVDINISGMYDFTAQWGRAYGDRDNPRLKNASVGTNNVFYQRFRTQIDIIASESLQGVLFLEIGDNVWGKSNANNGAGRGAGGGIGADGVNIEVRRAYIDWIVPQTDLQVRIGIQGFALPNLTGYGSQVFDDDVAGITASYQFNENVALTAWWLRPFAENYDTHSNGLNANRKHTKMDMVGLSVPLTFDGVKVTPWGMYSRIGRDAFGTDGASRYTGPTGWAHWNQMLPRWAQASNGIVLNQSGDSHGNAWWAGISADVTFWNPFRFAVDFNYGHVDMGTMSSSVLDRSGRSTIDLERSGWIVSAVAEYKLDFMTPGLFFWYGSGDNGSGYDGSEMMPQIKASSRFTTFGQDGTSMNFMNQGLESGLAGTWGIGAQLKDMSFIEDLKHTFRVAYYRGTNNKGMAQRGWVGSPWSGGRDMGNNGDYRESTFDPTYLYLTKGDDAWEFNFDSTYDIYKNLQLGVELGYIRLDLDRNAWGSDIAGRDQNMYKIGVGLRYTF